MAESYRGLTIRIGGDTTKLTKALYSANQSISGTQSSLKKLSDALKMDPTSMKAAQLQVGAFAEQASNAASRLATLNSAMQQIGEKSKTFDGTVSTVRQMAESWGNVSMKAAQARDYYNNLTKTIAENYTELSRLNKETAKAAQTEFRSGFDIDKTIDTTRIDAMKELVALVDGSKAGISKQLDSLKEMQEEYQRTKDTLYEFVAAQSQVTNPKEYDELQQKIAETETRLTTLKSAFSETAEALKELKFKGVDFTFDNKNVDLDSLKKGLQQAVAASKITQEEADRLYAKFAALKEMFKEAWGNVQTANAVEAYRDLESETTKAEAKVKSLVDEMLRLAKTSDVAKGLGQLKQQFGELSGAADDARSRMKSAIDIISSNTEQGKATNEGTKVALMQAYADEVDALRLSYENLIKQLQAYDGADDWVVKLANSTQSLVGITAQAEAKFSEGALALETYKGAADALKSQMDEIKADNEEGWEDSDEYKALSQQYSAMSDVVEVARSRFERFQRTLNGINEAGEMRDLRADASALYEGLRKTQDINLKPRVDASGVEGLKKALEAISKFKFDSANIDPFVEKVEQSKTALEAAKRKYQELDAAAKQAPADKDLFAKRTEALNQYMQKLSIHVARLNQAIAGIPSDKINQAAIATNTVQESFVQAKQKVDDLNEELDALEKAETELSQKKLEIVGKDDESNQRLDEITQELRRIKQLKGEVQGKLDIALGELNTATITKQVDEYRTEVDAAVGIQAKLTEEAKKTSATDGTPKIDQAAFMQAVNQVSQAVRRMGSEIVESSNEIDVAFRDMTKTVNGTEEELAALRESAIAYSQTNFTSSDTMLEMQALGGQLGVLTKDLEAFGKITSTLDIATDIDAEEVALKLGQISNVLNLDIDGMQGFSDALVRLGNNMPAQESAIIGVAQRFGAVAATANFSADEVLAWSASIAATGQRSEAAATAISNTVSGIEQAVAKGGDTLQQFAALAQMSSDEFVKSWQTSPTQTLRAFIDGLRALKESDESAVAALEEMGITGVRQQQTLLALTQTIDTLDDALEMSSNAWNGVEDQWGQAGDAAIEAEKKSSGFSGALQILRNNVQNLGASLGDGLVPAMNVASEFLALLTNALNGLPAPVKSAILTFGGLSIAFSTIAPLIKTFHDGWLGMLTAIGTSGSGIGSVVSSLMGISTAAEGATAATGGLASVMGGPLVIAATAFVGTFTIVYNALKQQQEEAQLAYDATTGLANAMSASHDDYETYANDAETAAEKLLNLREASHGVTEDNADFAHELEDAWSGINDAQSEADSYIQKIDELSDKTSRSKEEQGELVAAVEAYNDITGSSISVLDAEAGQLSVTTDELKKHNEAWKKSTEAEQAIKQYPEVIRHLEDAKNNLAELRAEQQRMIDDYRKQTGDLRSDVEIAAGMYDSLADEIAQAEAEVASSESVLEQTRDKLSEVGIGVAELVVELEAAGYSVDDFASLSEAEWARVARAYNGNITDAINMLQQFVSAHSNAKDIMNGLDVSAGLKTTDPIYKSYKKTFDNQYNELKAGLNSQYTAAKRSYDAQYKAAKDSYDAQYKAAQKHFDQQYKAAQKAYDKQYKELQKTLDNEYNERKKAYDKQLQALKDSQDAEVDAFNKATDEKLKAMEREYNQRVKLLEAEYGFKTDDIDERIKALEDQNKAEKQAIEDRKDEEKRAELQAAVDNAKSRRKRAEAEKALNDYIEEMQQKRNEDARKAEIERLKDEKTSMKEELDARKAALKEQYDAEVEQYKTSRNEQLEALKAANQAEYDAMKENLDNQLVALKEQQTERLEALKESQTEQLEAMKENQTAQLEAMKANQQAALENMKANQQAELDSIKASNDAQLQALKEANDAKLEALRQGGEAALRAYEFQSANMIGKANMLKEGMIKTADTMFDNIKKAFGLGRKDATSATKETVDDVDTTYGKMPTLVENTTKAATNAIASAFLGGRTDVKSASDEVVANAIDGPSKLPGTMGKTGEESTGNYVTGLSKGGTRAANVTLAIAEAALYSLDSKTSFAYSSGFNLGNNFASGVQAAASAMYTAVGNMANIAYSYFHHSTPDEGPLKHDDEWGGEMIQNLIDGMRDKESDLYRQVKKMSDIVEDGFDPTMSVDAAYEALDTIGNKRSKAMSDVFNVGASAPEIKIEMNLNLSDVTIREDADIERLAEVLSQKMAAQASRQLAGRLG